MAASARWVSQRIVAKRIEIGNPPPINRKESVMETSKYREAWNKGKLVGQKAPLNPKDIWAV